MAVGMTPAEKLAARRGKRPFQPSVTGGKGAEGVARAAHAHVAHAKAAQRVLASDTPPPPPASGFVAAGGRVVQVGPQRQGSRRAVAPVGGVFGAPAFEAVNPPKHAHADETARKARLRRDWWLKTAACVVPCAAAALRREEDEKFYDDNKLASDQREDFEALKLGPREVRALHTEFVRIDEDGSGQISVTELLDYLQLPRSRFTKRVFSIFDIDGSGEIDLYEFVCTLWNYCTLTKAALILFAFDLYDADSSGAIDVDEMQKMLKDVYGRDFQTSAQAAQILQKLQFEGERLFGSAMGNEGVDVTQFQHFAERHQGMLWPAFQMQDALRRRVVGERFWRKRAESRIELCKGEYVPIDQLLQLHAKRRRQSGTPHADDEKITHVFKGSDPVPQELSKEASRVLEITGTTRSRKVNLAIVRAMASPDSKKRAASAAASAGGAPPPESAPGDAQRRALAAVDRLGKPPARLVHPT